MIIKNKLDFPRDTSQYVVSHADTFRRASRMLFSSPYDQPHASVGGNRQNIEKGMRKIWVADSGYKLIQIDQSGADALIVAYLCKAGKYRQLFENGIKPHTYMALHLVPDVWRLKYKKDYVDLALTTEPKDLKGLDFWPELASLIKSSDDWASNERYYYFGKKTIHCVDKETEVLTRKGWVKVNEVDAQEEIMVWSQTKSFFEKVVWNNYEVNERLYYFNEQNLDQLVTSEHKIPYITHGTLRSKTAREAANYTSLTVPTCGTYEGGSIELKEAEVKLIAAIQADASFYPYKGGGVLFHLKKARKLERLDAILSDLNIIPRIETDLDKTGSYVFRYYIHNINHLLEYLEQDKTFSFRLLNLTRSNLDTFLKELQYWDGDVSWSNTNGVKQVRYTTNQRSNAEFIKTLLHLSNKRGCIQIEKNGVFRLKIGSKRTVANLNWRGKPALIEYNGKVYCPTTTTGFFFVRRNGKISITGNSGSYQASGNRHRMSMLTESGGTIVLDQETANKQIETFRRQFSEIPPWWSRVLESALKHRMIRNIFGFPYHITDYVNPLDIKDLVAWSPQSSVACITEQAISGLYEYIETQDKNWHILQETHDSILVEAPENQVEECAKTMKSLMEIEMTSPVDGVKFRMRTEVQVGDCWSPYKKGYVENGMKEIKIF